MGEQSFLNNLGHQIDGIDDDAIHDVETDDVKPLKQNEEKEAILRSMSFAFIKKDPQVSRKDYLDDFLTLKTSGDSSKQSQALKRFSPEKIGRDNWMIGLIGMLYDNSISEGNVIQELIKKSLQNLDEADIFFVRSILKAIIHRSQFLTDDLKRLIDTKLKSPKFQDLIKNNRGTFVGEELRSIANEILDLSGHAATKKLIEQLAMQPVIERETPTLDKLHTITEEKIYNAKAMKKIYPKQKNAPPVKRYSSVHVPARINRKLIKHVQIISVYPQNNGDTDKNITIVNRLAPNLYNAFKEAYEVLLYKEQINEIYVILPDRRFFPFYDSALEASKSFNYQVHVIDTQCFGQGVRYIADAASRSIINKQPTQDLTYLIHSLVNRSQFWVLPQNQEVIRNRDWYRSIVKLESQIPANTSPLINLKSTPVIHDSYSQFSDGVFDLMKEIKKSPFSKSVLANEIIVYHNELADEAQECVESLKTIVRYVDSKKSAADTLMSSEVGPFVAVFIH